jgi:hypothetical protein
MDKFSSCYPIQKGLEGGTRVCQLNPLASSPVCSRDMYMGTRVCELKPAAPISVCSRDMYISKGTRVCEPAAPNSVCSRDMYISKGTRVCEPVAPSCVCTRDMYVFKVPARVLHFVLLFLLADGFAWFVENATSSEEPRIAKCGLLVTQSGCSHADQFLFPPHFFGAITHVTTSLAAIL